MLCMIEPDLLPRALMNIVIGDRVLEGWQFHKAGL
jgi:hypothetical protein